MRTPEDWHAFVSAVASGEAARDNEARAKAFVDSVIKPGDAATAILDDLLK